MLFETVAQDVAEGVGQAEPVAHDSPRMTREQVMDRIIHVNPSASRSFLDQFADDSLHDYLDHLVVRERPRTTASVWIRRAGSPAMSYRISLD